MKYLVIVGDLHMGFEFIGPFNTEEDAQTWADRHVAIKTPDYLVGILRNPDNSGSLIDSIQT